MTQQTIVLITGTKAGIGRALLEKYAQRPNHTVIAAIRDSPDSKPALELKAIPTAASSTIIVAQYDASSSTAGDHLVLTLKAKYSIDHLDNVIANAGILKNVGLVRDSAADDFIEHYRINTIAPILLYKATADLLNASPNTPKFAIISSSLGSNGLMDHYAMPFAAYGMSKAAINYAAGKIHREEEKIVVLPIQPGWVQTAMGEKAAELNGFQKSDVPVTIEDSVKGILALVDGADKEHKSGKFWDQNGEELPW